MATIEQLSAMEILDSRGRPTVKAWCSVDGGFHASASVPSGASTGAAEALELRDGDPARYAGMGCRRAVGHINGEIAKAVQGQAFNDQAALDTALIELDGTPNKARLGANAILAVSIAYARAVAAQRGVPLYRHFGDILGAPGVPGTPGPATPRLPRLTINLFSGGKHAGKQVAIQDVLIIPSSPTTIDGQLVMMHDIYQAAARLIFERYGMRLLTADEGGLAPPFETTQAMLEGGVEAIRAAGFEPGKDAHLAVDVASSHFYRDGRYHIDDEVLDSAAMTDRLSDWLDQYPIASIEDGLYEDDWLAWPALCQRLSGRTLVLGDDFLCTNPVRIRRAIEARACDALLLKVNQIGTLSEAAEACRLAREAGWQVTISVRSGETEDDWAADLAVGWRGDQFKNGSVTQSERLAKYNRLLEIEQGDSLPIVAWPNG